MAPDDAEVRDFLERNGHLVPKDEIDWYVEGCRWKEWFWEWQAPRLAAFWAREETTPGREGILQLWEKVAKEDNVIDWHDALLKGWGLSLEERFVHWLLTSPQFNSVALKKTWDEADGIPQTTMKRCLKLFEKAMERMGVVSHIAAQSRASFYRIAERLRLLKSGGALD
jgi:hypothetical protein